jgi:hypothetical protein
MWDLKTWGFDQFVEGRLLGLKSGMAEFAKLDF